MQTLPPTFLPSLARFARRAVALAAVVTATAAFAQAPAPSMNPSPAAPVPAAAAPAPVGAGPAAWAAAYTVIREAQGADINGDGVGDFVNPTGHAQRGKDAFGSGAFLASRGGRAHAGVDYVAKAGQQVVAPIAGFVTKVGYAYADDSYRYIEITNRITGYTARVMYVGPEVKVGEALALGQPIGRAESLQRRYAGITNHVHLEIARLNGRQLDCTKLIPATTA
jgi:hypothetical protein